jgi:hypothetical protein
MTIPNDIYLYMVTSGSLMADFTNLDRGNQYFTGGKGFQYIQVSQALQLGETKRALNSISNVLKQNENSWTSTIIDSTERS